MPTFEKQFTPREAALLLHRSQETLIRWVKTGKLKAARLPGGHYLIPESEVLRVLATHEPRAMEGF